MAFHHAAIFFTLVVFLWLFLVNAHATEHARNRDPLRPTRTVRQRAFQHLDLLAARGYGKRIPQYSGAKYYADNEDFDKRGLLTARLYGKRSASKPDNVNNFLMEWMDLESKMRNMGYSRNARQDEMVLND